MTDTSKNGTPADEKSCKRKGSHHDSNARQPIRGYVQLESEPL